MTEELTNLSISISIIIAALIIAWLSVYALKIVTRRVLHRTETQLDDVIVNALRGPLRMAIVVVGMQIALRQSELIQDAWRGTISDVFFVIYLLLVYIALYQLASGITEWYKQDIVSKTETDLDDKALCAQIQEMLSDEPRSGAPAKFTPEQICQTVALSCEPPGASGRPITNWTHAELADEVIKRNIVESISPRSVGRFLKERGPETASDSILAEQ